MVLLRHLAERQRVEHAAQFAHIVHELNGTLELSQQLEVLQRHILQLVDVAGCWVAICDDASDVVLICDAPGHCESFPLRHHADGQPSAMYEALILEGRPILTDDFVDECRRRTFQPLGERADLPGRAWFGLPLRAGERIIGALAVWRWEAPIDAEVVDLLQMLAEQSATALDNARLYAAAQQRHREEAAFNAIAHDLTATMASDSILDHIARHARHLLGGDVGHITLYDPVSDRLRVRGFNSEAFRPVIDDISVGEGAAGYVWRTGQAIIAPDYLADTRFLPPRRVREAHDVRKWASAIAVPIAMAQDRLGVLQVGTLERRSFTARDLALLGRLATQAALAVRNARLFAAERERAARAEALREIGRDLSANLDLERLFDSLRRHLAQLTGLNSCWVGLCDEESAQLSIWVEDGRRRPEAEGALSLPLPPSMFREVVASGQSILTDDYVRECARRGIPIAGFQPNRPNRAWLGLPLQVRGRTIGALAVWRWDAPIEPDVVATLETLAGQIATALENARLYEATERQRQEEAAFSAIARDLAASLDGDLAIERIVGHALALLDGDFSYLNLYDPASGALQVRSYQGDRPEALLHTLRPGEGLSGQVWLTGQAIVSADYFADPRFTPPALLLEQREQFSVRSILAVPITLGEERLGTLVVGKCKRRGFAARDELFMGRLATQAALAVRNARLFAAERERAARAEALREIGRDLSANLNLGRLLDAIQRYLVRLAGPENFWVSLLDAETDSLRMYLWVEEGVRRDPYEFMRPLPLGPSLIATILTEQRPVVTDDYVAECRRRGVTPSGPSAEQPGRAWGCFPLIVGGKAIGALAVWRWADPLPAALCETLELFAGQIATALENARLYEIAERQRQEEVALNAIARDLAASLDGDTLLKRIADHARSLFDLCGSLIVLHDPASDLLRVVAGSGEHCARAVGATARSDEGLTGAVWQTRRPLSTANYASDQTFEHNANFDLWLERRGPRAVLAVPIQLGEQPLGVLQVISDEERRFIARDEAILTRVAMQAALAVHNARLYTAVQERAARLEVLNSIAHELSSEIDFERFLPAIWQHIQRIIPVDGCWVALWHEAAEELQFCLYMEDGERCAAFEQTIARDSGTGLAWAVLADQAPVRVADYVAECRRRGLTPHGTEPDRPNAPWLGLPLFVGGRLIGAMALWRRQEHFTDEEMTTLVTLANQLAATMENARLYQAARTLAVTDPLTGLLNHRHMQERFEQELGHASRHGQSLAVVMLDLDNFKLFNDTYGHPAGDRILRATAALLRAEARAIDIIARYGGDEFCLILPDTGRDGALALVARVQERCRSIGISTEQYLPLVERGGETIPLRLSAGIAVYPTDAKDRHELVTRADVALYANKRGGRTSIRDANQSDDEAGLSLISSASFGVIEGLVLAVDAKDHYTVAHSQLVADAAVLLGKALQLSNRDLTILRTAGLLHDVGKISIPDRILRKPGYLSAEEWQVMRQHVEFSELIIRGAPGLHDIREPVMHHHERWDGQGYPRGLAGEAVPLLGRIMIIADAFSAMTLDRPYRRGLSLAEAAVQLRDCAGSQFDPGLVGIFCEALASEELQRIVDLATHP